MTLLIWCLVKFQRISLGDTNWLKVGQIIAKTDDEFNVSQADAFFGLSGSLVSLLWLWSLFVSCVFLLLCFFSLSHFVILKQLQIPFVRKGASHIYKGRDLARAAVLRHGSADKLLKIFDKRSMQSSEREARDQKVQQLFGSHAQVKLKWVPQALRECLSLYISRGKMQHFERAQRGIKMLAQLVAQVSNTLYLTDVQIQVIEEMNFLSSGF